jgi:hypothetical protein
LEDDFEPLDLFSRKLPVSTDLAKRASRSSDDLVEFGNVLCVHMSDKEIFMSDIRKPFELAVDGVYAPVGQPSVTQPPAP